MIPENFAALASFLALGVAAVSWAVAGRCLLASLRVRRFVRGATGARIGADVDSAVGGPDAARGAWALDLWHAVGLLALLPLPGMWSHLASPAIVVARSALSVALAVSATGLAVWELATQRRYRDRSVAVAATRRFLTYGVYRRVRRPREFCVTVLVLATACALPGLWRPVVALLVFTPSVIVRARRAEGAEREAFGEPFRAYTHAVPLFFPWRRAARPHASAS